MGPSPGRPVALEVDAVDDGGPPDRDRAASFCRMDGVVEEDGCLAESVVAGNSFGVDDTPHLPAELNFSVVALDDAAGMGEPAENGGGVEGSQPLNPAANAEVVEDRCDAASGCSSASGLNNQNHQGTRARSSDHAALCVFRRRNPTRAASRSGPAIGKPDSISRGTNSRRKYKEEAGTSSPAQDFVDKLSGGARRKRSKLPRVAKESIWGSKLVLFEKSVDKCENLVAQTDASWMQSGKAKRKRSIRAAQGSRGPFRSLTKAHINGERQILAEKLPLPHVQGQERDVESSLTQAGSRAAISSLDSVPLVKPANGIATMEPGSSPDSVIFNPNMEDGGPVTCERDAALLNDPVIPGSLLANDASCSGVDAGAMRAVPSKKGVNSMVSANPKSSASTNEANYQDNCQCPCEDEIPSSSIQTNDSAGIQKKKHKVGLPRNKPNTKVSEIQERKHKSKGKGISLLKGTNPIVLADLATPILAEQYDKNSPVEDMCMDAVMPAGQGEQQGIAAWVCCDDCLKWRCIPAELVDAVGDNRWTCKDNVDQKFADCSVPQEKTDDEINAELGIFDVTGEEGSGDEGSWSKIKTNLFLHRPRRTQSIDESMICNCKPPGDGRMGCRGGCLNRMLNIECSKRTCPCGELCSNQQFQKRSYAKLKCFPCGNKGFGLQAAENIAEGKFVIEYVGEVLDLATYEARVKEYAAKGQKHFYFMTLNGGEVIDACYKGNLGRFINHSCSPNCSTEKWIVNGEVCIGLFATRNISKGEELTFDYNYVRVSGAAAQKCFCGSAKCRGYLGGDLLDSEIVADDDTDTMSAGYLPVDEISEKEYTRRDLEPDGVASVIPEQEEFRPLAEPSVQGHAIDQANDVDAVNEAPTPDEPFIQSEYELQRCSSVAEGHVTCQETNDNTCTPLHETMRPIYTPEGPMETDEDRTPLHETILPDYSLRINSPMETDDASRTPIHQSCPSENILPCSYRSNIGGANEQPLCDKLIIECRVKASVHARNEEGVVPAVSLSAERSPSDHGVGPAENWTVESRDKQNMLKLHSTTHPSTDKKRKSTSGKVLSHHKDKGTGLEHNLGVEERLNMLLDSGGGISKQKDATNGYLRLLLMTAAEGDNVAGIPKSGRDLSLILDALLKTKSYSVLTDIINKNGLQMLHNMLKQNRHCFQRIPIMRKLLKVLEFLASKDILTRELINKSPPHSEMESLKDSILGLTRHEDMQVHNIARDFRDKWIPRDKWTTLTRFESTKANGIHTESRRAIDAAVHQPSSSQPSDKQALVASHRYGGNPDPAVTRKRKFSWEPQSEAGVKNPTEMDINADVPPGFERPREELQKKSRQVPPVVASSSTYGMVVSMAQPVYQAQKSISYGLPVAFTLKHGTLADGTTRCQKRWKIAPSMPFLPFPPLPPYPRPVNAAATPQMFSPPTGPSSRNWQDRWTGAVWRSNFQQRRPPQQWNQQPPPLPQQFQQRSHPAPGQFAQHFKPQGCPTWWSPGNMPQWPQDQARQGFQGRQFF